MVTFSGARQENPKADTSTGCQPSTFLTPDVHKGQFGLKGDIWQGPKGDVFSCHNERGAQALSRYRPGMPLTSYKAEDSPATRIIEFMEVDKAGPARTIARLRSLKAWQAA